LKHTGFWWGKPEREIGHWNDLGVDGRIIMRIIIK